MITIDGHNLREIPLAALRRNIACVPQDNFLFSDTLQNNIAFGSDNKSLDAVQEAAKNACIHDNIMEFPKQYQTLVGERGVTLSGGQKQRVAIARMLTKKTPVIVFDDSLSAVDTETDEKIRSALDRDLGGATTIIISHRITTLLDCDNILVLEKGRVSQLGSPKELLAQPGIFRKIYDMQMSIGEEEGA